MFGSVTANLSSFYISLPVQHLNGGIASNEVIFQCRIAQVFTWRPRLVAGVWRVSFTLRSEAPSLCILVRVHPLALPSPTSVLLHCDIRVIGCFTSLLEPAWTSTSSSVSGNSGLLCVKKCILVLVPFLKWGDFTFNMTSDFSFWL